MAEKMGRLAVNTGYYEMDIREYPIPEPKEDGLVIRIETFCICGSDQHFVNENAPSGRGGRT